MTGHRRFRDLFHKDDDEPTTDEPSAEDLAYLAKMDVQADEAEALIADPDVETPQDADPER